MWSQQNPLPWVQQDSFQRKQDGRVCIRQAAEAPAGLHKGWHSNASSWRRREGDDQNSSAEVEARAYYVQVSWSHTLKICWGIQMWYMQWRHLWSLSVSVPIRLFQKVRSIELYANLLLISHVSLTHFILIYPGPMPIKKQPSNSIANKNLRKQLQSIMRLEIGSVLPQAFVNWPPRIS